MTEDNTPTKAAVTRRACATAELLQAMMESPGAPARDAEKTALALETLCGRLRLTLRRSPADRQRIACRAGVVAPLAAGFLNHFAGLPPPAWHARLATPAKDLTLGP